jgi:hypothetical protein
MNTLSLPMAPLSQPIPKPRWAAAICARNEAQGIVSCLHALALAGAEKRLHVTVLLNGCTDNTGPLAERALRDTGMRGRIYAIAQGDKANAFNQFVHRLRPAASTYFFIDGYAAVARDALARLDTALDGRAEAAAAAAVPSRGRSAAQLRRQMVAEPGLHGSLFALRGSFVERIAALGLRLPVGLYRGDGLVGSMVLHDLDAAGGGWKPSRLVVEPAATWHVPVLQPWRPRDLRRHFNRLMQQGRGRLQGQALRAVLYPGGFQALPEYADEHTLRWIDAAPASRRPSPWRDPFAALALARMRRASPAADLTPRLVWEAAPA